MIRARTWLSHGIAAAAGAGLCAYLSASSVESEQESITDEREPAACADCGAEVRAIIRQELVRIVHSPLDDLRDSVDDLNLALREAQPRETDQTLELSADDDTIGTETEDSTIGAREDALRSIHDQLDNALSRGVWTFEDEMFFLEAAAPLTSEELGAVLSERTLAINRGDLAIEPAH